MSWYGENAWPRTFVEHADRIQRGTCTCTSTLRCRQRRGTGTPAVPRLAPSRRSRPRCVHGAKARLAHRTWGDLNEYANAKGALVSEIMTQAEVWAVRTRWTY